MTAIRSGTASLLLDHVPEADRTQFIRDVVNNLNRQSPDSEVNFAITLLRQRTDAHAKQRILDHVLARIEEGEVGRVISICDENEDMRGDVQLAASQFVVAAARRIQNANLITVVPHDIPAFTSAPADGEDTNFEADILISKTGFYSQLLCGIGIDIEDGSTGDLFHAALLLTGSDDLTLCRCARDLVIHCLDRFQLTLEHQNRLWAHIQALSSAENATHKTIGGSLWFRWINSHRKVNNIVLKDPAYWTSIVDGLRHGDSERRKSFLQILRGSIDLAAQDGDLVSAITSDAHRTMAPTLIQSQYRRFCTIFETIVLGRYLNQVLECEADLTFLTSQQSAVRATWVYTLLASGLDNKMQNANRKFIGQWIMRSPLRTDDPPAFLSFFSKDFLPWVMQGTLFTSSMRTEGGDLHCQHGDKLAHFLRDLLDRHVDLAPAVVDAITSCLVGRQGNNFAYAMVYLMEGIGLAAEKNRGLHVGETQIDKINDMVGWIGLPEVARDYILARYWRLCKVQSEERVGKLPDKIKISADLWDKLVEKAAQLKRTSSVDVDGTVVSLSFQPSRRDINEQQTIKKCTDLTQHLQTNVPATIDREFLEERLNDIWSDVEYLEYPKDLLIKLTNMALNPHLIRAAAQFPFEEDRTTTVLTKIIMHLRELSVSRSYLLSPLLDGVRRSAFALTDAGTVLNLEDFIVGLVEAPPGPTIDLLLEDATSPLMSSVDRRLALFDYQYYFGRREGYGFAALLDLVSRLGSRDPMLVNRIFARLLARWLHQKIPAPSVSQWKKMLQLQVMLLCSEQILPRVDTTETSRILKDLHYILAVEPLPRYRYLQEWMIARVYIHHPQLRSVIIEELNTKDHHSNPKFLASLMKIGVIITKTDSSDEAFARQLATVFVPLAASSKVVIRHEAQWQIPLLLDHARAMNWTSIAGSTAYDALDEYIRSLERFGDPPLERQIDKFDAIGDHTLSHLVDGPWYGLDTVEERYSRREDFVHLYRADAEEPVDLPPSCIPLGEQVTFVPAASTDLETTLAHHERTLLQNIDNISRALGSGPGPTALQTKGAAYLESQRTRFASLLVVASLVDNPHNLGGLSRVSEIFGAAALYLPHMNVVGNKDFTTVSVSSHQHVDLRALPASGVAALLAEKKRGEGFAVVGIEQTDRSVVLGDAACVLPEKCVLVMGSEREGIPAAILSECDVLVEIPQVGVTRSLNVQTAAGIVLCEYARQWRKTR